MNKKIEMSTNSIKTEPGELPQLQNEDELFKTNLKFKSHLDRPTSNSNDRPMFAKFKVNSEYLNKNFQDDFLVKEEELDFADLDPTTPLSNIQDLKTEDPKQTSEVLFIEEPTIVKEDSSLDEMKSLTGEETVFQCPECDYAGSQNLDLLKHLVVHTTREKPHHCLKCTFKCLRKSNLFRHMLTHSKEETVQCPKCPCKCKNIFLLKKHILTDHREKLFHCSECDYNGSLRYFISHLVTHGKNSFQCPECEYKCSSEEGLENHMLTHIEEKLFHCDQCDYKCNHSSRLKLHIKTHTNEKPFQCIECDYKGSTKIYLMSHMLTHIQKSVHCLQCEYKFADEISLRKHIRTIHTIGKPFKCPECEYTCRRKAYLPIHMRIHSQEKPFGCNQCECRFNHKKNMKKHILSHEI